MNDRHLMYPDDPDDQTHGPYSIDEIQKWFAQGSLPPGTLISRGQDWVPVQQEVAAFGAEPSASESEPTGDPPANILPKRPVLIRVSPAEPEQRLPAQLRNQIKRGLLSPNTEVQVATGTRWLPIAEAQQRYPVLAPTRVILLAVGLFLVPPALMFVHLLLLGLTGTFYWFLFWVVSAVAALLLFTSHPLRASSPLEVVTKKKVQSGIFGGVGLLLIVTALVDGLQERAQDQRIAALVEAGDPCAVEQMSDEDRDGMGWSQESDYDKRKEECTKKRADEKRRAENQQRDASCAALVGVLQGKQSAEERLFDDLRPSERELSRRIATGKLADKDLLVRFADLPCSENDHRPAVANAFVKAAGESADAWKDHDGASPDLLKSFAESGTPVLVGDVLLARVEAAAKKALATAKVTEDLAPARKACAFSAKLNVTVGNSCTEVYAVYSRLEARERAEQSRKGRAVAAQQDRYNRCDEACETRHPNHYDRCMKKCCSGGAGCGK